MKQLHVKQTYKLVFLKMLVDLISCSNAVWGSAGKKKQHIKYVCLRQRWLRKFTCNLVTVNLRTVNYTSPKPHYISIACECFFLFERMTECIINLCASISEYHNSSFPFYSGSGAKLLQQSHIKICKLSNTIIQRQESRFP